MNIINKTILKMKQQKLNLTVLGDVQEFLGVQFSWNEGSTTTTNHKTVSFSENITNVMDMTMITQQLDNQIDQRDSIKPILYHKNQSPDKSIHENDTSKFKSKKILHMKQPFLIQSILRELKLCNEAKIKETPGSSTNILLKHNEDDEFDNSFDYRRVIGMMNYLAKCTRPDIEYQVHQCARFSSCPKKKHGQAVRWIGRYLLGTKNKGIIFKTNEDECNKLTCYVDADFVGNYKSGTNQTEDIDTARSRYGFVINYDGIPMMWASKLQTVITLSSTESEYVGLSEAARKIIPIMRLMLEMKDKGFIKRVNTPAIQCTMFEDNEGAIEMSMVPKVRARTKHIHVKYHHFVAMINEKVMSVRKIGTKEQVADILTKPLSVTQHKYLRLKLMGWQVNAR